MAALATAMALSEELSDMISTDGPLSASFSAVNKSKTPILLLGGSSDTLITKTAINRTKAAFQTVEYHRCDKAGETMPKNRDGMMPIMKYLARRMQSRKGMPEGSVVTG